MRFINVYLNILIYENIYNQFLKFIIGFLKYFNSIVYIWKYTCSRTFRDKLIYLTGESRYMRRGLSEYIYRLNRNFTFFFPCEP